MSSAILHLRELSLDDAEVCLRCAVVYPGARDHPLMTCLYCSGADELYCPADADEPEVEYFIPRAEIVRRSFGRTFYDWHK